MSLKAEVNRLRKEVVELRNHLEGKVGELNALFEFAASVGQLNHGINIYRLIPESLELHLGLEEVAIFEFDQEREVLRPVGLSSRLIPRLEGMEFSLKDPILGKVYVTGEPLFYTDLTGRGGKVRESPVARGAGSLIAFPIKKRDRVTGVFVLSHPEVNAFDGETLSMVKTVTRFISIVLENVELYQYARMMAERDSLTHLYNHGTFHSRLEYELERGARYGRPLSVIMFDIDGFKLINDNFGHAFGDKVLRGVAGIVNAHVRKTDIPARYGGDEFAILLPETDLEAARAIAGRISSGLASLTFDTEKAGRISITASFGVTSCGPDTPGREKVVEHADALMYEAKKEGYGRVHCRSM
ncbi:MAG: GGDEF domain-containing protein [Deltaproteobacteria bacterium]|nr:MAG: GGDEF domain-containing protein [Deltaproteobacteria bacterium]